MNFIDLLRNCNVPEVPLDRDRCVRLVRHRDLRLDLELLLRLDCFEEYQARQARDVFAGADHLVSFIGERGTRSRFVGVYRVLSASERAWPPWPRAYPYEQSSAKDIGHYYDLERVQGFEDLEDRMIIDWGAGTRSWVQWLKPKDVIEVLPVGAASEFPGYLDFVLDHDELSRIVLNPDANRVWRSMLGAVAGVYLINDTMTGDLYVGSAYGKDGILGRWGAYVRTGHGGNKELRELLAEDPGRQHSFAYSILRTLPRTLTNREVIEVESLFKRKLGSRAFGLNSN